MACSAVHPFAELGRALQSKLQQNSLNLSEEQSDVVNSVLQQRDASTALRLLYLPRCFVFAREVEMVAHIQNYLTQNGYTDDDPADEIWAKVALTVLPFFQPPSPFWIPGSRLDLAWEFRRFWVETSAPVSRKRRQLVRLPHGQLLKLKPSEPLKNLFSTRPNSSFENRTASSRSPNIVRSWTKVFLHVMCCCSRAHCSASRRDRSDREHDYPPFLALRCSCSGPAPEVIEPTFPDPGKPEVKCNCRKDSLKCQYGKCRCIKLNMPCHDGCHGTGKRRSR